MGVIVIAVYKPKPGKEDALKQLMTTHLSRLQQQGLATGRKSIMMEAADGAILEVFEWTSMEAIQSAHTNPAVLQMWGEYAEVCEYGTVSDLAESKHLFGSYKPLN